MIKYLLLTLLLGCASVDCKKEKDKCSERDRRVERISTRR